MFDHHDRDAALQFEHQVAQARRALCAEAGRGLVEEQQPRLRGQRHADLERTPFAIRQPGSGHVLLSGQSDTRQHLSGLILRGAVAAEVAPHRQTACPYRGQCQQHVVERGLVVEQVHRLERPRQPFERDSARRQPGDVDTLEHHAATIGPVAPGEHVEAGGLAGAVRPHDAGQPAFVEGKRHVLQHHLVAEAFVQPTGFE